MRARVLATGAVLLLLAAQPYPALAAPVEAPIVLASTCPDGDVDGGHAAVARSDDGRLHGFVNYRHSERCGQRITYVEGAGTSWRAELTPLTGAVIDVAADRTGTYLLAVVPAAGAAAELAVVKRSTDGRFGQPVVVAPVDGTHPLDGQGSIVAAHGTWYAVWSQYQAGTDSYTLYQAETMFGGGAEPGAFAVGNPPGTTTGTHPALALGPDGQVRLFWQRPAADGSQDLRYAVGAYGAWGAISEVAAGEQLSPDFPALDVAVTGSRTYLSWTRRTDVGDQVLVAGGVPGAWRTSTPPVEDDLGSWDAHLVASGGTVFAGYGTGDGAPDGAFLAAKSGNKAWSAADATTGIPRSIDSFGVAGLGYDGGGRCTALIYSGNRLSAVSR